MWSISDPKVDDDCCDHDADALQQVSEHVDEGGADAGVAVAAEERVGVAMSDGTLAVLVDLVIAAAMSVEGGGVMEDVGHAAEKQQRRSMLLGCLFKKKKAERLVYSIKPFNEPLTQYSRWLHSRRWPTLHGHQSHSRCVQSSRWLNRPEPPSRSRWTWQRWTPRGSLERRGRDVNDFNVALLILRSRRCTCICVTSERPGSQMHASLCGTGGKMKTVKSNWVWATHHCIHCTPQKCRTFPPFRSPHFFDIHNQQKDF